MAAISGSALARQMDSRDVSQQAAHQNRGLTTFLSPLPTIVPENEIELARVDNHDDGNSNSNADHSNVNPKDHNDNHDHSGTVNSNNSSHDDHGGNVNTNDNRGNEEHGGNINSSNYNSHNDHVSNSSNNRGGEGE